MSHSPFWEGRVEMGRGSKVVGGLYVFIMAFRIQAKARGWDG